MSNNSIRVLAVASNGGHWEQLMLLLPTLTHHDVRFATTELLVAVQHGIIDAESLPDCNQKKPLQSALCAVVALKVVLKHRPAVIISTGAAPGFFCILAGRLIGARTLWIDSVANAEEMSLSGRLSQLVAHACWTQWPSLAKPKGPHYHGAVL